MYRNGGCATISTWFCSSGFGPGPSSGGTATVLKGCAGPEVRKLKNAAQQSHTNAAYGMYSGCLSRFAHVAPNTYNPITRPQNRIEPSSEDHRLTTATQFGTCL